MSRYRLRVNGKRRTVDVPADTPLLWALREELGLTGPRYGCGVGACGACVSLIGGEAGRPCVVTVSESDKTDITTIEGLQDHPVQQAWLELDVAQCGYCQPGQIMTTVALLARHHDPTDAQIDEALRDNVCRCGTYPRIRAAVHRAAALARGRK
ncbi:aerobic-type carbon monoxide dehydrogenase small subunit (CoxS/CutS family) [Actinoplanes lutulentus]|uniref:Isoquinoline 1-oxidoreductase alpha subunit n=1 Tax=Actinoplanes lutulentus TaxID=1287878 RepID=A0A327Z7W5_9ACTN|nr:(2Fe-2S)-binding protein [Actinoplanes lutulentus]MBB2949079.1 aerobic-type carbon monoxide dehydrogenase small subunit (CoxS/CutS family) [Actinoplanes lutulentus]RAK31400.1 isoquinoline 1-oxidoreductase alpha subunit [Actinoplanes lutulentus]